MSAQALEESVFACLSAHVTSSNLYLGLSGGVDSTALLMVAARWAEQNDVRLVGLHANHGLQPEALDWQRHCEQLCQKLAVSFVTEQLELPDVGNVEALAREKRYQFFRSHVSPGDHLLLAHHAGDQTETALLRLIQGRGVLAMQEVSRVGGIDVLRPLLSCQKEMLVDVVRAAETEWVEDESNQDLGLDRNFIRHQILPDLYARWPQLDKTIARVIDHQTSRDGAMERLMQAMLADSASPGALPVSLLDGDIGEGVVVLRAFVAAHGLYDATDKALAEFVRQAQRQERAKVEVGNWEVELKRGWVSVERR